MNDEYMNLALLICNNPIKNKSNKIKIKYLQVLKYYIMKYSPNSIYSYELLKLYSNQFINEDSDNLKETNSLNGIFKWRFVLFTDICFVLSLEDEKMAQKICDDYIKKVGKPYRKKLLRFYERLYKGRYVNENFSQVNEYLKLWDINKYNKNQIIKKYIFTANMSAGKSTLINALIGKKINKSQNDACTAKLHYIYNKPYEDTFITKSDNYLNFKADKNLLLNDNENNNTNEISVDTYFRSDILKRRYCFLDTPGVNSFFYSKHRDITEKAILSKEFDVYVYVINGSCIGTDDEKKYLQFLAEKLSCKPFIFILNKADLFRKNDDSIKESINKISVDLNKYGFKNWEICPVSAYAGILAKLKIFNDDLGEDEVEELNVFTRKFKREEYRLDRYYDKEIINKCKEVLKFKEGNIYWQLLNNCGLLPLEFIINLQGE